MPELRVISPETLLATCGGDEEVLARMITGLRGRLPPDLESLRSAVTEGDLSRVRQGAHKLYGMVSAFSEIAGAETSALEDEAERGDGANLEAMLARLEATLARLVRELEGATIAVLERMTESS